MRTFNSQRVVAGFLVCLVIAVGCGKDGTRPRVRGRVTFKGNPVGGRTLTLYSEGAAGEFFSQKIPLGADGTFSGEVPAPGKYKVVIEESMAVQEGAKPADRGRVSIPPQIPGCGHLGPGLDHPERGK